MNTHPVMVNLPKRLYTRLEKRAQQTSRNVESELLSVVAQAMAGEDELPEEISNLLEELSLLDDKVLWRIAHGTMKADQAARMEQLHLKRRQKGLSESEAETLDRLVRQYERHMLTRAQSAALLKQRGHDVSKLLTTV